METSPQDLRRYGLNVGRVDRSLPSPNRAARATEVGLGGSRAGVSVPTFQSFQRGMLPIPMIFVSGFTTYARNKTNR